jgi:hypothetical protein
MTARTPAFLFAVLFLGTSPAGAALPDRDAQEAEVRTEGNASTLVRVDVAGPHDSPPSLLGASKLARARGFDWWTSRHFALRTDCPAERARGFLELLELAYPHYVRLAGREPGAGGKGRLAVTYGATRQTMLKAMAADLGYEWDFEGGGMTLEGYFCAYAYPSGGLEYHQRYIVLHECAHLVFAVLNGTTFSLPGWANEGAADSVSHHVYDSATRTLRVHVLDKATTHNYLDEGLSELGHPPASLERVVREGGLGRGSCFLAFQYFHRDPAGEREYCAWRDEAFRLDPKDPGRDRKAADMMGRRFGGWQALNSSFKAWLGRLRPTFHYVTWGWEQDGDTLWSRYNSGEYAQTDVDLPPGEKPAPGPLRLDYPPAAPSPLVGKVRRGGATPSVGFVVDLARSPDKGQAGIGMGTVSGSHPVPFGPGELSADPGGRIPGLTLTSWRLDSVRGGGTAWEDLSLGATLTGGAEPRISLGEKGSLTAKSGGNFAVEWSGWLKIPSAGTYSFATGSDDGSWLLVGNRLVVDNGGYHAYRLRKGAVRLPKGRHQLKVRFFQGKGERALRAGYAPSPMPGSLKVLVEEGRRLVIDGSDLECGTSRSDLPAPLVAAARNGERRMGVTVVVGRKALEVTVRAGSESHFSFLPLSARARGRILQRPLCLLAREGEFGITPCFDDGREAPPG